MLPSLDRSPDQLRRPLLEGVFLDHADAGVPNGVQEKTEEEKEEKKEEKEEEKKEEKKEEGKMTVLSVGRFQVAQILEHKPVTVTTRTSQVQRSSLFHPFSSSSSSGVRR
ncbi:hypothetical protein EYF80_056995 [Liparis tanakae]|uniref:Uncharacterized protein n=1 Tax=Liparis tanakae TaxID=230148 RepID=A0A4Z2EX61_9TELE|nr:hypothetical protein EYF80_056995 [Liparis tanakae]